MRGSISAYLALVVTPAAAWWAGTPRKGLPFECTGCGKCCRVEGDVWMSAAEQVAAAGLLEVDTEQFDAAFVAEKTAGWALLKAREDDLACVFLDEHGQCGIYEARPIQCSAYPWWPSILRSEQTFWKEAVASETDPTVNRGLRKWDPIEGGCEGIHPKAEVVPAGVIKEQYETYMHYYRQFSRDMSRHEKEMANGKAKDSDQVTRPDDDTAPSEVSEAAPFSRDPEVCAIGATSKWITDFVIRFGLCPFASGVEEHTRFVVTSEQDLLRLEELIFDEASMLAESPAEEISATMIIFTNIGDDPEYMKRIAEKPRLELGTSPFEVDFVGFQAWFQMVEEMLEEDVLLKDQVMAAHFHPEFLFGGDLAQNVDNPVHFEKRAPFPTLNLLRVPQIDEAIAAGTTQPIASRNADRLGREGIREVRDAFQELYDIEDYE